MSAYFREDIETLPRSALDALIDERTRYTVKYAYEHSPFYRKWFDGNGIDVNDIHEHADLLKLPIVSGATIRKNQPPETPDFNFKSVAWDDVFTIHETSGTSGVPKSFFLTWDDWKRYAEKYARAFKAQGFGKGDRLIVCASYGMNVGANTMTLAAQRIGMTIIPEGRCDFPIRTFKSYGPTGIVASMFKLLRLARRMKAEGLDPKDSSVNKLILGGESFADESRDYVREIWGCDVFNTYGSTEGTMCGECGRMVLTTLLPPGGKCGTLLINYDTEDTTVVLSREKCACGRTHMKVMLPQRESETYWAFETPFNRVDVERGVFQRGNMEYLTGEYEASLVEEDGKTILDVSVECIDPYTCDEVLVKDNFLKSFFMHKRRFAEACSKGSFDVRFNFAPMGNLEIFRQKGRSKRVVDKRPH